MAESTRVEPPNPPTSTVELPDQEGYHRSIRTRGAYEQRSDNPRQNYGISGVDLTFTMGTEGRAVAWTLLTGHFLPDTNRRLRDGRRPFLPPTAGPVEFHRSEAQYEGHEAQTDDCPLIGGGPCFIDHGYLLGDTLYAAWAEAGIDGVFDRLRELLDEPGLRKATTARVGWGQPADPQHYKLDREIRNVLPPGCGRYSAKIVDLAFAHFSALDPASPAPQEQEQPRFPIGTFNALHGMLARKDLWPSEREALEAALAALDPNGETP